MGSDLPQSAVVDFLKIATVANQSSLSYYAVLALSNYSPLKMFLKVLYHTLGYCSVFY